MEFLNRPHRRFNPLTREWVLVSPQRARRPWLGQVEKSPRLQLPAYDPDCYLCPGNSRAGGVINPIYPGTYVFDNDYPALFPALHIPGKKEQNHSQDQTDPGGDPSRLLSTVDADGICRVVCFSPRHDLTLPELSLSEIVQVVKTWIRETAELSSRDGITYVQVFENKGEMMGCSNPHPHSQIWATSFIPNEPENEILSLVNYQQKNQSCMLCNYLEEESAAQERIVASNEHFFALVPFWSVWPFELMVISKRHIGSLLDLNASEITGIADILKQVTIRYDNLFEISFPYSMGFHQFQSHNLAYYASHLHAHFYPPLLRSATVKKFMVGFEMLAMPQRDLTAESAAEKLRSLPDIHYLNHQ